MQAVGLAADAEGARLADAGRLGDGDRLGIVDAHERPAGGAPMQLGGQRRAVTSGAAADIVAHVEQADRAWQPLRTLDRVGNVGQVDLQRRPHLPQRFRNPGGLPLRGALIAVGYHGHRGTHLDHVGVGEPLPEAGREDARTLPDGVDPLHQRGQWRFVGALLVDADPERRKYRRQVGCDLAVQPVDNQAGCLQAALALIDVRMNDVLPHKRDLKKSPYDEWPHDRGDQVDTSERGHLTESDS